MKYDIDELKNVIDELGIFTPARIIQKEEYLKGWAIASGITGEIQIEDKKVRLVIGFPKHFPYQKPLFFIQPFDKLGFIPHISEDGTVCYTQNDNLVINYNDIKGIISDAFFMVKKTLEDGYLGTNHSDFLHEFEDYWKENYLIKKRIIADITLSDKVCKFPMLSNHNHYIVADNNIKLNKTAQRFYKVAKGSNREVLYIPLEYNNNIRPPKFNTFWSLSKIRDLVFGNLSDSNKATLNEFLKNKPRKDSHIILRLTKPDGTHALVGIRYRNIKELTHPLNFDNPDCRVLPLAVKRVDKELIIPRGGGNEVLAEKNILVVGCGSLGSEIICQLVKAGCCNFTIIDADRLYLENIYRHNLGQEYLDKFKVEALKKYYEKNYPYTVFETHNVYLEDFLAKNKPKLAQHDLAVVATGSPTVNMMFNEIVYKEFPKLPVIYTWLEPYGIGGHSLLVKSDNRGCYKCLYPELYNRASFAAQEQSKAFTKTISGCTGLYTPFDSVDIMRTCMLVVKQGINILLGDDIQGNPIASWKGASEKFETEGFKLSSRFNQSEKQLINNQFKYVNENCEICHV